MAFPFTIHNDFETGVVGDPGSFETETDANNILSIAHVQDLARFENAAVPWAGAFCGLANLRNATGDSFFDQSHTHIAGTRQFYSFYFFLSADYEMGNNEILNLLEIREGSTIEVAVGLQFTAGAGLRLGAGSGLPTGAQITAQLDRWYHCEVDFFLDSGGADGTIDFYVDGVQVGSQITGIVNNPIDNIRFGANDYDAGTSGLIQFDRFIIDEDRVYPQKVRFKEEIFLQKSAHAFVGAGRIANVELLSGNATDNILEIFDTNRAYVFDETNIKIVLRNSVVGTNTTVINGDNHFTVKNGCYVRLSGTGPRAIITTRNLHAYGSDGAIKNWGSRSRIENQFG